MPRKKISKQEEVDDQYEPVEVNLDADMPMTAASQSKSKKDFLLYGLLVVAAFFIGSLWTRVQVLEKNTGGSAAGVAAEDPSAQAVLPQAEAGEVPPLVKEDHIKGDAKAEIALIEYSDIECPFCKSYHPTVKRAVDEFKGKVKWVYRHYPLSFHANAAKEAEAVECANELGGNDAFWKYLDTVIERTTSNGTGFALDKLVPLAGELGLDQNKFKQCLDSGKYATHVQEDMNGGTKAGVEGTPGTILLNANNGEKKLVSGAVPFETLKLEIENLLK